MAEAPSDNNALCSALPVPLRVIVAMFLTLNVYTPIALFSAPLRQISLLFPSQDSCSSMSCRWFAVTSFQVYCLPSVWRPANIYRISVTSQQLH